MIRLTGAIAILAMVALPALAQTQTSPSSQNSGAGIAGQPGVGRTGPRRSRPQAMIRVTPRPSCRTRAKSRVSPVARAARQLTRLPSSEATEPFSRMFVVTPDSLSFLTGRRQLAGDAKNVDELVA